MSGSCDENAKVLNSGIFQVYLVSKKISLLFFFLPSMGMYSLKQTIHCTVSTVPSDGTLQGFRRDRHEKRLSVLP